MSGKWYETFMRDKRIKWETEQKIKCTDYFSNIRHEHLKLDDVKNIDGSKMFIAIIDYEDSKVFRKDYPLWIEDHMFPSVTMLGNIDGNIYDFLELFYLDLDKYTINYAESFSSLILDEQWRFKYDFDDEKVILSIDDDASTKKFNDEKMRLLIYRDKLRDDKALSKVLGKN